MMPGTKRDRAHYKTRSTLSFASGTKSETIQLSFLYRLINTSMKTLTTFAIALTTALLLTACGKKEEASTKDIWTSVAEGDLASVQQYIDAGGDLDAKDPVGGGTPLIVAAVLDQTEAAKLLIENGADLEVKNTDGSTAVMAAAFFCHPDMVKLLLEKGADSEAKNGFGQTALDVSSMEWNLQIEQIYQAIGGMLQMELDIERIKTTRPVVAQILRDHASQ